MKRQKRDISLRAYNKGYQLGYQGRSEQSCPFQHDSITAREWIKGWQEGHRDKLDGINILASQQKVIAMR